MDWRVLINTILTVGLIWLLWPVISVLLGVFVILLLVLLAASYFRGGRWGHGGRPFFTYHYQRSGERQRERSASYRSEHFESSSTTESEGYDWAEEGEIIDLPQTALRPSEDKKQ